MKIGNESTFDEMDSASRHRGETGRKRIWPRSRKPGQDEAGFTFTELFSYTPVEHSGSNVRLFRDSEAMTSGDAGAGAVMTPKQSALISVYNQSWPTPSFFNEIATTNNWQLPAETGVRPSKDWVRDQITKTEQLNGWTAGPLTPQAVDKNTLKWKMWTNPTTGGNEEKNTDADASLYKLTTSEFRRLSDQVKDINPGATTRVKGPVPYKKYWSPGHTGDRASHIYRSQLASSAKVFQKKQWAAYSHPDPDPWYPVRCRPVPRSPDSRPLSAAPSKRHHHQHQHQHQHQHRQRQHLQPHQQKPVYHSRPVSRVSTPAPRATRCRPKSSPAVIRASSPSRETTPPAEDGASEVTSQLYDTLSPAVVYELSDGQQPESLYGDRPESAMDGLESELADIRCEDGDDDDADQASSQGDGDPDTDIDSDEDVPEPSLDNVQKDNLPSLELRPEVLDSLTIPGYPRGDRRKYDFDVNNVEILPYDFKSPLSADMQLLDIRRFCQTDRSWRELTDKTPVDEVEGAIMDRLMKIQKLQMKSEEQEAAKQERLRISKLRASARSRNSGSVRVASAKSRDRFCCPDCLQPACVGNCPSKEDAPCLLCRENHCTETCTENVYAAHCRHEREPENSKQKPKTRSRSCTLCQKRHTAKYINANNIVLGRPKSGHATFSRGQGSEKPKDLRPKSAALANAGLEEDLEKLGLECVPLENKNGSSKSSPHRPHTAGCTSRGNVRRGRASVIPGKSYFSQRRRSLTDRDHRIRLSIAEIQKKSGRRSRTGE